MTQPDFLQRLEQEASIQSQLHDQRILPSQLDLVTTLVGRYPWQTLALLALATSIILELVTFFGIK